MATTEQKCSFGKTMGESIYPNEIEYVNKPFLQEDSLWGLMKNKLEKGVARLEIM